MTPHLTALRPAGHEPTTAPGAASVLWCACGTQITGYGFVDAANPPSSPEGPWLCLFCAAHAARERPGDITQVFTTDPVPPGSVICPATVHTREDR